MTSNTLPGSKSSTLSPNRRPPDARDEPRHLPPWDERPGAGAEQFALKTKGNPIGVVEYQLQPKLPAELKGKLPTAKQLADAMKGEMGRMKDELQRS